MLSWDIDLVIFVVWAYVVWGDLVRERLTRRRRGNVLTNHYKPRTPKPGPK